MKLDVEEKAMSHASTYEQPKQIGGSMGIVAYENVEI